MTPSLPPAYRLVALETIDSTNAEAKRLAAQGEESAPDGTLVWALAQTAGRGRRGRRWESPEGNLYCSLILRPEVSVARAAELAFVAALAVYDTIGSLCSPGQSAACKWPNDVLLNGRKVSGILLESQSRADGGLDWLVLGVGINVESAPAQAEFPATALHREGDTHIGVVDVLEGFARHFLVWTNRWLDDGFRPIRENWLWRAAGKGETIRVRLDRETLEGTFEDIDERGALVLGLPGTVRRIAAGDVFFPE
ncbi:MAG: biotin--[acetyl-CoA-carboxylase] ligase [Rhodospirillales bacterium]|nr:biotin--[acetyl-CoA-carboxylase] ligase [Rhodospirillales bacterium]